MTDRAASVSGSIDAPDAFLNRKIREKPLFPGADERFGGPSDLADLDSISFGRRV